MRPGHGGLLLKTNNKFSLVAKTGEGRGMRACRACHVAPSLRLDVFGVALVRGPDAPDATKILFELCVHEQYTISTECKIADACLGEGCTTCEHGRAREHRGHAQPF